MEGDGASRYLASDLDWPYLVLAGLAWGRRRSGLLACGPATALRVALSRWSVILQGLLGMWTVTAACEPEHRDPAFGRRLATGRFSGG